MKHSTLLFLSLSLFFNSVLVHIRKAKTSWARLAPSLVTCEAGFGATLWFRIILF